MLKKIVAAVLFAAVPATFGANLNTLLMPADRLAKIRGALPQVANPLLTEIFLSPEVLWYDETVMSPSYQDSIGASANSKWPNLVAGSESVIGGMHDRAKHRWRFPFGATAGTDDATNLQVENFVRLPQVNGQVSSIPITKVIKNDNRPQWMWTYPEGTVFGEILFIKDGGGLLPVEIRTRTRYVSGWAMNAYRPFPRAVDLAAAIKEHRPNWNSTPNLRTMVDFLEDTSTLRPTSLKAQAKLAETFQQDGYLDVLPDFEDDTLVRELLTTTRFRSAYNTAWKENGDQKTFAASTKSALSIVPTNYTAGLIRVSDESCMRCHKEAGRLNSEFYFELYLYGEIWGKDGIFSFHPFDESLYPKLRLEGYDNRALNPKLKQARIFKTAFGRE